MGNRIQALSSLAIELQGIRKQVKSLENELEVRVIELQRIKMPYVKVKLLHQKIKTLLNSIEEVEWSINSFI